MPDAHTHDIITVISGAALAPVTYVLLTSRVPSETAMLDTVLFFGAHVLSGVMFSPDLDIDSAIDDRWGIFYWIWRPYMWVVPHRHRILSHGLIVSALLRLLYFYLVVVGLLFVLTWALGLVGIVFPTYYLWLTQRLLALYNDHPRETLVFLVGFITGGAAHTLADWLVTGGKHFLRRFGVTVRRDYRGHDYWLPRVRRRRSYRQ